VDDSVKPQGRSNLARQIRASRARASGEKPKKRKSLLSVGHALKPIPLEQAKSEWNTVWHKKNWRSFPFQRESWEAYFKGKSGLILSATGSGKTFASLGGPLMALRAQGTSSLRSELRVLYISPLKALVRDVEKNVQNLIDELGWSFRLETRTGDTSAADKKRQTDHLPHLLFTTPESFGLLITQPGWRDRMRGLLAIVLDEWHELLGSKRGSLLELNLARLRAALPTAQTWAASATLADPEQAAQVATGVAIIPTIIRGEVARAVTVQSVLPQFSEVMPWFGYRGLNRLLEVAAELDPAHTTLIFTNTRGQSEAWYSALSMLHPEWEGLFGLHHGSIDREERARVEEGIKDGTIPFVIATSSLDLGVDFPAVEKVIQIGSVKGVTRATQRAGRAFHRPGEPTRLLICPTHFLEYLEVAALRNALEEGLLEERAPLDQPLDVLVQFVLSSALGEGFAADELLRQIRSAFSFREVSDEAFSWILNFATTGGHTLRAYAEYKKLVQNAHDGIYRFATAPLARAHRMNMGTIVGESSVTVRFQRGATLGQIDEGFVTKLKRGDIFSFTGKNLELILIKDLVAYVKLAKGKQNVATVWGGQALPISPGLSRGMRELLAQVARADDSLSQLPAEVQALKKSLRVQRELSAIPGARETLVERLTTRDGYHLFVYTWEGRLVNEGLGHLLAIAFLA
jgi:ATP-dependent Lhr-like helicase